MLQSADPLLLDLSPPPMVDSVDAVVYPHVEKNSCESADQRELLHYQQTSKERTKIVPMYNDKKPPLPRKSA